MNKILKFFLITLIISLPAFSQQDEGITGRKAPNFKLEDINGNYVELKKLIGKGPLLLSFWATWCKPCIEELSEYSKIFSGLKERGFNLLAISTDNEKTVAKVKPFVKSKGYDFTVLLDSNSEVARKYYAQAVPYTVLIDKSGNIVYSHLGYAKGDEKILRTKIEELLNK